MTDARSDDYARARDAFASLPLDEKLGFLFDASLLTVARGVETVGERLSEEFSDLASNLRGEVRKAADAMESFADEAAESVRDAAARAEAFADDLASTGRSETDPDDALDAADDGIEPTDERASDEIETMLDNLFGPDDEDDAPKDDARDELPPL